MMRLIRKMKGKLFLLSMLTTFVFPALSFALDGKINGEAVSESKYMADTLWVILAGILVFFMQAGFSLVESGFTRAKNAINIMMKNLMDFSIGSIAFWTVGFAIMFGNGNGFFGTTGFFVHAGSAASYDSLAWTSVPVLAAWFFQLVFAATAATIVSGAMAERTKFTAYLCYSFFITAVFYPIIGHWIWGGGWLASLGMLDFAGSTVVHSTGAWFALAGAIMLGPRKGKYAKDGSVRPIPGHNIPIATLGTFILWFGWFGFNPGSTMGADVTGISNTAVTTNLAAAAGALTAMITAWMRLGKPDVGMTLNGALAGLVAITAPCYFVTPLASVIIGAIAGILVVLSVFFIDKLKIDDPVGAISVHGVCGAFGTIMLGVFSTDTGLLYGHGIKQLVAQLIGVVSVFGFCVVCGFILFGSIKALIGLRTTEEEEVEGLDFGEHGGSAYPDFVSSTLNLK